MQRADIPSGDHIATLPDGAPQDVAALDAELSRVCAGRERVLWAGPMWGGTDQRIIGYGAIASGLGTVEVGSASATFRRLSDLDLAAAVSIGRTGARAHGLRAGEPSPGRDGRGAGFTPGVRYLAWPTLNRPNPPACGHLV